jgi:ubiquinone/menaquinone biosynthesis C-methylase UbiE
MKMVRFEKWFINKDKHGQKVIQRAEKLLELIDNKEKKEYLEVGCGNGSVCKHLAETYPWNVTGVDIDPEQIQLANERSENLENVRFLEVDATELPFEDNGFDIVLSFGTTHHIPDWSAALGEIKRVLKPEGYFIYYDLIYPEWLARLGRSFKHGYGIVTIPGLKSFVLENDYCEIYTSKRNSVIWYDYEAVYRSA